MPVIAGALLLTRRSRFPVTEVVIVWAALLSGLGPWRATTMKSGAKPLNVGRLAKSVMRRRCNQSSRVDTRSPLAWVTPPISKLMVVVAVEGGASRAGYWIAETLGELERATGEAFSLSVLALSSGSDGSVGTAAFVSQLHDQRQPRADIAKSLTDISGEDFLSPVLGGLLFPDLLQRVIPTIPIPLSHGAVLALLDRAEPLEKAFEASWRTHCRAARADCMRADLWRASLLSLAPGWSGAPSRWTPALVINGAREEDGRRTLTATVAVDPQIFSDALDFRLAARGDPSISTAMLNGARFPIVSPGATMITPDGRAHGHILDSGYFEGSGVSTARDIVRAVLGFSRAKTLQLKGASGYVRPLLIEINNGSEDKPDNVRLVRASRTVAPQELVALQPPAATSYFLSDIFGPLLGVSQSRDGRGAAAAAAAALSDEMKSAEVSGSGTWASAYRIIHLCKQGRTGMPMDWTLSEGARSIATWALTNCTKENVLGEIERMVSAP